MKKIALFLIRFYQNTISVLRPAQCRFYPSCSHYTKQAIEKYGFWKGTWKGLKRFCRCHPFSKGGVDLLE